MPFTTTAAYGVTVGGRRVMKMKAVATTALTITSLVDVAVAEAITEAASALAVANRCRPDRVSASLKRLQLDVLVQDPDDGPIHRSVPYGVMFEDEREIVHGLIADRLLVPWGRGAGPGSGMKRDRVEEVEVDEPEADESEPEWKKRKVVDESDVEEEDAEDGGVGLGEDEDSDIVENGEDEVVEVEDGESDSDFEDDGCVDEEVALEQEFYAEQEEVGEDDASGGEEETAAPTARTTRATTRSAAKEQAKPDETTPAGSRKSRAKKRSEQRSADKVVIKVVNWVMRQWTHLRVGRPAPAQQSTASEADDAAVEKFAVKMKHAIKERHRQANAGELTMTAAWKWKLLRIGVDGVWEIVDQYVPRAVKIAFGNGVPTADILRSLPQATDVELNEFGVYISLILSRPDEAFYEGRYIGSGTNLKGFGSQPGVGSRWWMYELWARLIGTELNAAVDQALSEDDMPRGKKGYYKFSHTRHGKQATKTSNSWEMRLVATIPKNLHPWVAQLIEGLFADIARTVTDICPPRESVGGNYQTPVSVEGSKKACPVAERHPQHDKLNGCSPFMQGLRYSDIARAQERLAKLNPDGQCWCCQELDAGGRALSSINAKPVLAQVCGGSFYCKNCRSDWRKPPSEKNSLEDLESYAKAWVQRRRERTTTGGNGMAQISMSAIKRQDYKCPVCEIRYEEAKGAAGQAVLISAPETMFPGFRAVFPDMRITRICTTCYQSWRGATATKTSRGNAKVPTHTKDAASFARFVTSETARWAAMAAAQKTAIQNGTGSAVFGRAFKLLPENKQL